MNMRIEALRRYIQAQKHFEFRKEIIPDYAAEFASKGLSGMQRSTEKLLRMLDIEVPVILPEERIVCTRTVRNIPNISVSTSDIKEDSSLIYTKEEWNEIRKSNFIHYTGDVNNVCPDYEITIRDGLEARRKEALESLNRCIENNDGTGKEFLNSVIKVINAVESFAEKYAKEARRVGNEEVDEILSHIPKYGARTFHEALQFLRILNFTLYCAGNFHSGLGRFDQYMYPYLVKDLESGVLNRDSALELLEEFFISLNKDTDMYYGLQQGDNGQTIVLGGVDENNNDAYNLLSEMCLTASLELKLIDPKINLRVHNKTSIEVFEFATRLTKEGLGFPQYCNDEVVIPALVRKGYDLKDARNYVVAACWEFIIPGYGMDIVNISALSFPKVIDACLHNSLKEAESFENFMQYVRKQIEEEFTKIQDSIKNLFMIPAPFLSILMDNCVKNARDISKGGKYNNYGIHGTGISNAVDSLAVIKKYVFDEKKISSDALVDAVDKNFEGYSDMEAMLKYDAPKMGNNDQYVDSIAVELLGIFADCLESGRNDRNGVFRPGSGTAMYYLWHAKELGASPDGRKKGEPLSANFSPSLNARLKGPVSVIRSFTKPNLKRIMNGGPLTLELHDTTLRNEEGIKKVAALVKFFIDRGGHQLQLNAVNKEKLIDAQVHPELHQNLIVRVWGWSAYFVQLDKEYQDHIIKRTEFTL